MSCEKVTMLVEKSKVDSLSFKEIITLKLHLRKCVNCNHYNQLSDQLDQLFEGVVKEESKNITLSDKKKQDILDLVRKAEGCE